MATYQVTTPEGKFQVEAETPEEANVEVKKLLQEEANTKSKTEFSEAPVWAKPFIAADDLARTTADTLTWGGLDRLIGGDAAQETAARRSRMGGADIAGDVVAGMAVPTGVPAAVARIGGGPVVRGITGLLGGAASGGAQGATSAALHDEPVAPGAAQGILGGSIGQAVAGAVKGVVNPISKWWKGVDDTLPPPTTKNVPGKAPNPARRVENAAYMADKAGGTQAQTIAAFKEMNQNKLPTDVLADIRTITHKDLGTRSADLASSAAFKGAGAAPITGFHSIPMAMALTAGLPMAGYAAKAASGQGTSEAVEKLRRKLLKIPKYEGPISKEQAELIARATRSGIMSDLD